MNNNNPQQILELISQNHKFGIDPFGVHEAFGPNQHKLTPRHDQQP